MPVNVLQAVLIFTIAISLAVTSYIWIIPQINIMFDSYEIASVRNSLEACGIKIIDTARTGNDNLCFFPVSRGSLEVKQDGIYYSITSGGKICDITDWVELEPHLWIYCPNINNLNYRWSWPRSEKIEGIFFSGYVGDETISFDNPISFTTITAYVQFSNTQNITGNNIYLRRTSLTEEKAVVEVRIK